MTKLWRIGLVMEGGIDWIGGVEYIKNLVFAIQTLPVEVKSQIEIFLICDKSVPAELYESILPYLKGVLYVKMQNISIISKVVWRISRILFNLKEYHPSISRFLSAYPDHKIDFLYPCFTTSKKINKLASAAWLSDFQHKYLPQLFSDRDIEARDKWFSSVAEYSSTVVVSSQSARNDFHHFYPESKAKVEVLSFTTFPVSEWFSIDPNSVREFYSVPKKFFLVSNQFWQHKNHEVVLHAIAILNDQKIFVDVVCTGKQEDIRNPNYIDRINTLIDSLGISNQLHVLGLIPKEHQVQMIRSSLAIVQPSLFEGWSTVVEDARCFGKRIALSNISVHLEQNPPQAMFFDAGDPTQLAIILKSWWQEGFVGFDEAAEQVALKANQDRIQSLGYKFFRLSGIDF
jgi:glycosyltransferase involved in cell wall biosynthesis